MYLYFLLLHIVSLWNGKARLLVQGQRQTIERLRAVVREGERWIWFHAASSGEFEQVRPLIERLRQEQPKTKLLITFFSPSGYEMYKEWPRADLVCYLPFATRRNARHFLNALKPDKALFVKYEFWPAYLRELQKRNIETYSVASIFRPCQAFFRPLVGPCYRRLLKCFTRLLVQDEASRLLLAKKGITQVTVCGDPRFNRVMQVASRAVDNPLVSRFADGHPLIVAGSTWLPDEKLLARYVAQHPEVRLLLVPHEIDEIHMHRIFRLFKGRILRYSEADERNAASCPVMVINRMGLLSSLYRHATVAYIGGGFGAGIHNTLEAAAYGVPVLWGPRWRRFREAEGLIQAGGGFAIHNYTGMAALLDRLLPTPAEAGARSLAYVLSEQDATDRIYQAVFGLPDTNSNPHSA